MSQKLPRCNKVAPSLSMSGRLEGMTIDQLILAVGIDAAARLTVLRSELQSTKDNLPLTVTDAKGDATDAFCEQCESYLVNDSPRPALELAFEHRSEHPDHEILFLEPAFPEDM